MDPLYRITNEQCDAIIAGLRLLQCAMLDGLVKPGDGDVGDILTNSGQHAGLSVEAINDLLLHVFRI